MMDCWTDEDDSKETDVNRWLELYEKDRNNFWRSSSGHYQNVIDELLDRIKNLENQKKTNRNENEC